MVAPGNCSSQHDLRQRDLKLTRYRRGEGLQEGVMNRKRSNVRNERIRLPVFTGAKSEKEETHLLTIHMFSLMEVESC